MEKLRRKFKLTFLMWTAVILMTANGNFHNNINIVHAETTVYVTPTGSKYHSHKCGNGTYTPAPLSSALARGLTPCSKCFGNNYVPSPEPVPQPTPQPVETPPVAKPIKINKTSILLVKGQTAKLKISNATETISWRSSKTSVATVSNNGKITAKKKGKATITATIGTTAKKCTVTVESPKLNNTSLSLNLGQMRKLKLSGCKHSIKWTSSNTSIAKVKKGTVTAKRVGSAKITAKVHGKKFTCKVIVKKPTVQEILLGTNSIQMGYWKEQELQISTLPANAMNYYKISVTSSDSSIVSASFDDYDNTVLLNSNNKSGKAVITVSIGGKTAKCQVNVAPDPVTSLTLDTTTLTLKTASVDSISFRVEPYDATKYYDIIWASSNPSVATVESSYNGSSYAYIQAVGEGEADISVTVGNKTAVCHVIVVKSDIN